jgi:hypothetical protein
MLRGPLVLAVKAAENLVPDNAGGASHSPPIGRCVTSACAKTQARDGHTWASTATRSPNISVCSYRVRYGSSFAVARVRFAIRLVYLRSGRGPSAPVQAYVDEMVIGHLIKKSSKPGPDRVLSRHRHRSAQASVSRTAHTRAASAFLSTDQSKRLAGNLNP